MNFHLHVNGGLEGELLPEEALTSVTLFNPKLCS